MPSMTGWITSALVFAAALSSAAAQESALVVGAVISETGSHAAAAADYRHGLLFLTEEVKAAGGPLRRRLARDGRGRAGTGSPARLWPRRARDLFRRHGRLPAAALSGDGRAGRRLDRLWRAARRRRHGEDAEAPRLCAADLLSARQHRSALHFARRAGRGIHPRLERVRCALSHCGQREVRASV